MRAARATPPGLGSWPARLEISVPRFPDDAGRAISGASVWPRWRRFASLSPCPPTPAGFAKLRPVSGVLEGPASSPFSMDRALAMHVPSLSRLALAVGLLMCTPAISRAQKSIGFDASKLDPALTSVVTGGYWESGGRKGSIRLLVFNSGWNNVRSRLVVQWI